mmetsp:Transcript_12749/g.19136  ORF Transcript_12749/g.19136 Transcript_12749/m.19136 type:complete len:217 (+) Transcript_12749:1696-2346(+)
MRLLPARPGAHLPNQQNHLRGHRHWYDLLLNQHHEKQLQIIVLKHQYVFLLRPQFSFQKLRSVHSSLNHYLDHDLIQIHVFVIVIILLLRRLNALVFQAQFHLLGLDVSMHFDQIVLVRPHQHLHSLHEQAFLIVLVIFHNQQLMNFVLILKQAQQQPNHRLPVLPIKHHVVSVFETQDLLTAAELSYLHLPHLLPMVLFQLLLTNTMVFLISFDN